MGNVTRLIHPHSPIERAALQLFREAPHYATEARDAAITEAPTLAGAVLSLSHHCPRWIAEDAIRRALERIDNAQSGRASV